MDMDAFVCMFRSIKKNAGGLTMPQISQNLWKKGRKQDPINNNVL